MATRSRVKGIRGEREVAERWQLAGAEIKAVSNAGTTNEETVEHGDHLIVCANGLEIHGETKYAERWKLPEWWAQTVRDAPQGTIPVLHFRRNHGEWLVTMRLDDLTALVTT